MLCFVMLWCGVAVSFFTFLTEYNLQYA